MCSVIEYEVQNCNMNKVPFYQIFAQLTPLMNVIKFKKMLFKLTITYTQSTIASTSKQ